MFFRHNRNYSLIEAYQNTFCNIRILKIQEYKRRYNMVYTTSCLPKLQELCQQIKTNIHKQHDISLDINSRWEIAHVFCKKRYECFHQVDLKNNNIDQANNFAVAVWGHKSPRKWNQLVVVALVVVWWWQWRWWWWWRRRR